MRVIWWKPLALLDILADRYPYDCFTILETPTVQLRVEALTYVSTSTRPQKASLGRAFDAIRRTPDVSAKNDFTRPWPFFTYRAMLLFEISHRAWHNKKGIEIFWLMYCLCSWERSECPWSYSNASERQVESGAALVYIQEIGPVLNSTALNISDNWAVVELPCSGRNNCLLHGTWKSYIGL